MLADKEAPRCPYLIDKTLTLEEDQLIETVRSLHWGRTLAVVADSRIIRVERTETIETERDDRNVVGEGSRVEEDEGR
jgi:hypothetical protein